MSSSLDPCAILPYELNLGIFANLDMIQLAKCSQVSKTWQIVASDDQLWKGLFPIVSQNADVKKHVYEMIASTDEALLSKVAEYPRQIDIDKVNSWECIFLHHPNFAFKSSICIFHQGSKEEAAKLHQQKTEVKKMVIFTKKFSPESIFQQTRSISFEKKDTKLNINLDISINVSGSSLAPLYNKICNILEAGLHQLQIQENHPCKRRKISNLVD
jgi:hypothetical protein